MILLFTISAVFFAAFYVCGKKSAAVEIERDQIGKTIKWILYFGYVPRVELLGRCCRRQLCFSKCVLCCGCLVVARRN